MKTKGNQAMKDQSYSYEGTFYKIGRFGFLYRLNAFGEWKKSEFCKYELLADARKNKDHQFITVFASALLSEKERGSK